MTADQLGQLSADLLLTLFIGCLFVVLYAIHRIDLRRRRRRVAALRAAGDFGPRTGAVGAVVAAAGSLDADAARRLAGARRDAFAWDPRLDREPKAARTARDRAFANERDDVAVAASGAARDAASAALGALPPGALEKRVRAEAAECAAETAGALVGAERIPADEFRMLTRAWRTVVGPVGVAPRKEP